MIDFTQLILVHAAFILHCLCLMLGGIASRLRFGAVLLPVILYLAVLATHDLPKEIIGFEIPTLGGLIAIHGPFLAMWFTVGLRFEVDNRLLCNGLKDSRHYLVEASWAIVRNEPLPNPPEQPKMFKKSYRFLRFVCEVDKAFGVDAWLAKIQSTFTRK